MSGTSTARRISVGLAATQATVADAVRAGLRSRGLQVSTLRWPTERRIRRSAAVGDVGLLISDLERGTELRAALVLIGTIRLPWVLLTSAPYGPLWGAVLDAGVRLVLPNSTSLVELSGAVVSVARDGSGMPTSERDELITLWRERLEWRQIVGRRLQSLTPREREVLLMLHAGDPVARIAQLLEISQATVRSQVKAILRKLEVNTQLGAVATLADLQQIESLTEG